MKNILYIILALVIASCGSSKNALNSSEDKPVVTDTTQPAPQIEDNTEQETPELPDESEMMPPPEIVTPQEPEIIDDSNQYVEEDVIVTATFDHSPLNDILTNHVSPSGNVNYAAIKKNWSSLRTYIKSLGEHMPKASWSKNEKLAYWMNAYNAMTIDLILRHQPLESIKDIKNPWKQRFWKLGEKYYNLDEIEHQILRKMDDPRIHFGINCASFSCPPLLNEAFTAQKVDAQLDQLARAFINDPKRNSITSDRVEISKIFNWFAKDFKNDGSIIDYLNTYATTRISEDAKVRFMDYDWSLNN